MTRTRWLGAMSALAALAITFHARADVPPMPPTDENGAYEAGYATGQALALGCVCFSALAVVAVVAIVVVVLVRRRSP